MLARQELALPLPTALQCCWALRTASLCRDTVMHTPRVVSTEKATKYQAHWDTAWLASQMAMKMPAKWAAAVDTTCLLTSSSQMRYGLCGSS